MRDFARQDFARHERARHDGACTELGDHLSGDLLDEPFGEHTVYFQISNGAGRFACSVRLKRLTREEAISYLSDKWPAIEQMALMALANRTMEHGEISLVIA